MNNATAEQLRMYRSMEGPLWRWDLGHQLAVSRSHGLSCLGDEVVKEAASFITLSQTDEGTERAAVRHPQIAAALAMWDEPKLKQQFTILILGDCDCEQVAARLGVTPEVVKYAELLFLDIRDFRKATSWVNAHVIMPEFRSGDLDLATKYRAALWGGPLVTQTLLDAEERVSSDEVERIADLEMLLHMKLRQALEIPLDPKKDALRMVKLYLDHEIKTKRLEFEKEKFRHRCEQDILGHQLAELRLEATVQREEARATAKRQREAYRVQLKRDQQKAAEFFAKRRQDQKLAEQDAAVERAAISPLAKLVWSSKAEPQHILDIPEQAASIAVEANEHMAAGGMSTAAA